MEPSGRVWGPPTACSVCSPCIEPSEPPEPTSPCDCVSAVPGSGSLGFSTAVWDSCKHSPGPPLSSVQTHECRCLQPRNPSSGGRESSALSACCFRDMPAQSGVDPGVFPARTVFPVFLQAPPGSTAPHRPRPLPPPALKSPGWPRSVLLSALGPSARELTAHTGP